jgi:hypothetical protein
MIVTSLEHGAALRNITSGDLWPNWRNHSGRARFNPLKLFLPIFNFPVDSIWNRGTITAMKILIEIDDEDEYRLTELAKSEMRSNTAQAKKLLVDGLRREYETKAIAEKEGGQ